VTSTFRMVKCGVCANVNLIKQYKELGVCAKCYKTREKCTDTRIKAQCISCLGEVCNLAGLSNMCTVCVQRKGEMESRRPELVIKKFLQADTDLPPAIHNKCDPRTRTQCSRARVDFRLDFSYFQVIIEVDENQHKSYGETCELIRLLDIVNASGGMPLVIFRINPDRYRQNGKVKDTVLHTRILFMKERILLRSAKILRRIKNCSSRNIVMPILYIEYLFFDEGSSEKDFRIRTFLHDTNIAKSIQKCQ